MSWSLENKEKCKKERGRGIILKQGKLECGGEARKNGNIAD